MVRELGVLFIRSGMEEDFEAAFREAARILMSCEGCLAVTLMRCLEERSRYDVRVEWSTVEDHVEGYGKSERRPQVQALIRPFVERAEPTLHFREVFRSGEDP